MEKFKVGDELEVKADDTYPFTAKVQKGMTAKKMTGGEFLFSFIQLCSSDEAQQRIFKLVKRGKLKKKPKRKL